MNNNLRWICENDDVETITISKVEAIFGVKFPTDYIDIVMKNDGGYPMPDRFNLNDNEEVFNNLLSFDEEDSNNILDTYYDVKDRLFEEIIPFAEDPFGNLICFDYRQSSQPTVVFWEHETASKDKNAAIKKISDTFTELLDSLYEHKEEKC